MSIEVEFDREPNGTKGFNGTVTLFEDGTVKCTVLRHISQPVLSGTLVIKHIHDKFGKVAEWVFEDDLNYNMTLIVEAGTATITISVGGTYRGTSCTKVIDSQESVFELNRFFDALTLN